MSEQGKRVYKAHIHYEVSAANGITVFCHYGHLTPCGEWVDGVNARWPLTPDWCDSEAEAMARLAPRIAEIGARLIRQAGELLEAGKATEVVA